MGLLDMFKSSREVVKEEIWEVPWEPLETLEQIEALTAASQTVPVVIFKHSTTCGISRMALRSFEKDYAYDKKQLKLYFLDIKQYREISNAVSQKFDVVHESPQLLLIKNENAVHTASHSTISADALAQYV